MIKERVSPLLGRDDAYTIATSDGSFTLFSKAFQATYHSIFGAVSESKHTYIQNCLNTQVGKPGIRILEFGFGTGLNAFLAFLFSQKHTIRIDYTGLESFPLDISLIHSLDYPGYLACPEKSEVFLRMHETNSFVLDKFEFHRFESWQFIPRTGLYDCIFFDAFAPEVQPELWGQEMFDQLFAFTSPAGCLVTYCAKGQVRRCMEQSGYVVTRIPGAPGKRQMLQAFKPV